MFASQTKQDVKVGDLTVRIRKLSWKSLEKAAEIKQGSAIAASRALGGDLFKAFREADPEMLAAAKKAQTDPEAKYGLYDQHFVLHAGIESWSAPVKPEAPDGIDDLDVKDARILFHAIVDLSHEEPGVAEGKG